MNVITQSGEAKREKLWSGLAAATKSYALVVVPSLESERMVAATSKAAPDWRPGGLVKRDGTWQKHYERAEIEAVFARHGFALKRIGRAHYPWSVEGLRETKARRGKRPWDWIALAKRK